MLKKLAVLALPILIAPVLAFAQSERSYHYESIKYVYTVHPDTTVSVDEEQTYAFNGVYHQAVRTIPHKGLDAVSDAEVFDGETGLPLAYSRSKLDKTKESSWNKYTVYNEGGQTYIEWYYDLSKTRSPNKHTWIVRYNIHGALAFYKDHDELYWNIFTDYAVPVDSADVSVVLPGTVTNRSASFYTTSSLRFTADAPNESSYHFLVTDIPPQEDVTFAVGWQKGLVDQSAYWRDFFKMYWQFFAALAITLCSLIYSIVYWRREEYINRGRGTIVPEYDPPKNLRPAMAEVLAKGRISQKAWPASVVDLAVRGYLKIEEEKESHLFGLVKNTEYVLTKIKEPDTALEEYEKDFMDTLFAGSDTFSTAEVKKSPSLQHKLARGVDKVTRKLYQETATDTNAFDVDPGHIKWTKNPHMFWRFVGSVAILSVLSFATGLPGIGIGLVGGGIIMLYAVFLRTRLNQSGHVLKEEWLGFKMYLETAEKYRMQNLTPDIFEKYLPYAIMFGVEKKWAKAFETLNIKVDQPGWYTPAVGSNFASSSGMGFSPSGFSSAFSASFVSSFASSGGGGASGGGGGAGGGGGGGGGGAS
jgi:uncharacterized membrane protein